ncbi:MAG: hypothetical protein ABI740_02575 [Alphaproteobacteria bacterium]
MQRLGPRRVGEFGHRLGRQVLAEQVDALPERIRRQVFEQVGDVGGVKFLDRSPQERLVPIANGADHASNEARRDHACLFVGFRTFNRHFGRVGIAGVIHGDLPLPNGVLSA